MPGQDRTVLKNMSMSVRSCPVVMSIHFDLVRLKYQSSNGYKFC